MFKKASDYAQSREHRKVTCSTHNDYGVDPTAFAAENAERRSQIIQYKRELEFKIGAINRQPKGAFPSDRGALGAAICRKLMDQRQVLRGELAECHVQLHALKAVEGAFAAELRREDKALSKRERKQRNIERFEQMFMQMAREMLAHEIYDRILVATIHRIREVGCDGPPESVT